MRRAISLSLVLLAGCASRPTGDGLPSLPSGSSLAVERFVGGALTGPSHTPLEPSGESELVDLHIELQLLEALPSTTLDSLSMHAAAIADRTGRSLEPASIFAGETVVARGEDAQALRATFAEEAADGTRLLIDQHLALPLGATVIVEASRLAILQEREFDWRPDPAIQAIPQHFALRVTRPADGGALQLLVDMRGALPRLDYEATQAEAWDSLPRQSVNERMAGKREWGDMELVEELVVIEGGLQIDAGPLVVMGRSPLKWRRRNGMAFFVEVSSDISQLSTHELAGLNAELEAESAAARQIVSETTNTLAREQTLARVLSRLTPDAHGRRTLAVLAHEVNAELCADFALVSDEATFTTLVEELLSKSAASSDAPESTELAWRLERHTYALLARSIQAEGFAAQLAGVLLRHAGEVGRYPSSIEDGILVSPDLAAFRTYLVEENLVFLGDPNPSARVRAFDWLRARSAEPEGFDPLGSVKQRRTALARFEDERAGLLQEAK